MRDRSHRREFHTLLVAASFAWAICSFAQAADVNVVGLSSSHAIVVINDGEPHVMSPGSEIDSVKLLSVNEDSAQFLIDGRRQTLGLGEFHGTSGGGRSSTTLVADGRGHYITQGQINGGAVTFLVDTGSTFVVLSGGEAQRLGIRYRNAPRGWVTTANGVVPIYRVTLDTVKVGDIVINNVDAAVQENGLPGGVLLGMSFLSRTDMTRDGANMVLTKRY